MQAYRWTAERVLRELNSAPGGLSRKQAAARLAKHGENRLARKKGDSLWRRFMLQLSDPMILVLLAAAAVSAVLCVVHREFPADVLIIMTVVTVNAVLGVVQESKAEKAIAALQEMTPATSRVLRGGAECTVPSRTLVPGDVVLLSAGDRIPADCRVLESIGLRVEESALTGESQPVEKSAAPLPDDGQALPPSACSNLVFMGANVVYGRGRAVVIATGMDTQMGRIAHALNTAGQNATPLQKKLTQLSKILSLLVLAICAGIFALDVGRSLLAGGLTFSGALSTFMVAVSLAVAAIPEGLAAVVTIVLSIGVTKMSRRHAVIRRLTAVETLGCTQVICSDKTGTLTQNKMTVTARTGVPPEQLMTVMALCSDAHRAGDRMEGEPTEVALVLDAADLGLEKAALERQYPRVGELPFDSARKMMTTLHRTPEGVVQYTKGAPDVVLKRCTHTWQQGRAVPLTADLRRRILDENRRMADRALRVLCAATRQYPSLPSARSPEALEQGLCYLGLVGMMDPVRPEAVEAIAACRQAGIRPVMITGDHRDTAAAIARQLGILEPEGEVLTGAQLSQMDDRALDDAVARCSVFARVQPTHKVRIVEAFHRQGAVTAMTGDGVNDAPAIQAADIGVGMGMTGTDVTKNVADMVLTDDNFATIVAAVEEGRRVYDNIRKSIQFLLSSNLAEVLTILVATLLGFTILEPVHLLWINLITDCFPALALGMERGEPEIMRRRPRDPKDGIFAGGMGFDVAWQGLLVTAVTLLAYFSGLLLTCPVQMDWAALVHITDPLAHKTGMTMAFFTLSMAEIFHSFNMRSRRASLFSMGQNGYLWGAMVLSLVLSTVVLYVPALAAAFDFVPLSGTAYGASMALALAVIPVVELVKAVQRAVHR